MIKMMLTGLLIIATNVQIGEASYYKSKGDVCASNSFNVGDILQVTNLATGDSCECVKKGSGPFIKGRIIDLGHFWWYDQNGKRHDSTTSPAAKLKMISLGHVRVKVEKIN
jgi:rare lipoprotein A (peptidoglycan hydrolase)